MYGFGYRYSPKGIYVPSGGGGALDPDADAFITAATITDPTEISAVNQLVIDMKDAGIWTKMKAVYPFVGGTATTHKWNLIDPQDTNAAFRLTFSGGWTHSSTGALPNGTNGYADTHLNALNDLSSSSFSMGVYLNSVIISNRYHLGLNNGTTSGYISIRNSNTTTKQAYIQSAILSLTKSGLTSTTNQGLWALSKRSNSDRVLFCSDGSFVSNTSTAAITNPSLNVYLGAQNANGTAANFDTMSHAFDFISDGLNDTELTDLRSAVINFQTTLGRAV